MVYGHSHPSSKCIPKNHPVHDIMKGMRNYTCSPLIFLIVTAAGSSAIIMTSYGDIHIAKHAPDCAVAMHVIMTSCGDIHIVKHAPDCAVAMHVIMTSCGDIHIAKHAPDCAVAMHVIMTSCGDIHIAKHAPDCVCCSYAFHFLDRGVSIVGCQHPTPQHFILLLPYMALYLSHHQVVVDTLNFLAFCSPYKGCRGIS